MVPLEINPQITVADLFDNFPQVMPLFIKYRMACVGCSMSIFETVEDAARNYDLNLSEFLQEIYQAAGGQASA